MEPILLRFATQNGFKCRMDTQFLSFDQDTESVTSMVKDLVTGQILKIRSKYLMGADGARNQIVRQLGLELDAKPGDGVAIDVLARADLSHLVQHRTGNLHWIMQPDVEYPDFGWMGIARMVKPWHEWILSFFPSIHVKKSLQRPMTNTNSRVFWR
jgi:2-polyprenyl-6-methoxyphenol hydroxylase-like FAD-dependent oxidoreductase